MGSIIMKCMKFVPFISSSFMSKSFEGYILGIKSFVVVYFRTWTVSLPSIQVSDENLVSLPGHALKVIQCCSHAHFSTLKIHLLLTSKMTKHGKDMLILTIRRKQNTEAGAKFPGDT